MHKSATLWLALGIMCPLSSLAVGLSSIHIHSALNQPFSAEIDVLGLRDMPIGDLNVQVANQELYQQMGLEKSFQLSQLQFKVTRNSQGAPVVLVSSNDRITEPYLELVLNVKWPNGGLIRNYTVLLDPPNYTIPAVNQTAPVNPYADAAPAADNPVTQGSQSVNAAPAAVNLVTSINQARNPASDTVAQAAPAAKVWKVEAHQTLSSIAERTLPNKKVSLDQAMLAIEGENPQAFAHQNVNQLLQHSRLQIPSAQLMESIPEAKAEKEIAAQSYSWHHHQPIHHVLQAPYYSAKLATVLQQQVATSVESPIHSNPATTPQASTALPLVLQQTPLVEQQPEVTSNTPGSNQTTVLRTELSATVSEAQQMQQRNSELQQQVVELQQQNHVMQQVMMAKLASLDQSAQQLLQLQENKSAINTEQKPVAQRQAVTGQSIMLQNDNGSGWLSKLLLVLLLSGGVAGIWFTYRRKFFVLAALSSYLKPGSVATESFSSSQFTNAKAEMSSQKTVKAEPVLDRSVDFEKSSTESLTPNRSSVTHEFKATDDLACLVPDSDINSTKLELARIYLTMGDKAGAVKLIDEVIHDGTQQQCQLAKQLLSKF